MRPTFKARTQIYQSKANLDENISFDTIPHHLDPEIWKMLVNSVSGNKDSTFHSGPWLTSY